MRVPITPTGALTALALTLTGCAAATTSTPARTSPPAAQAPTPVQSEPTDTETTPQPAGPTIEDGVWLAGDDFPAGAYTAVSVPPGDCYWAIYAAGTNGEDIVQNEHIGGGHPTVVLKDGQEFKSARCGTWATDLAAERLTTFADGSWTAGRDIRPGTYRTDATVEDCYWAIYTAETNTEDLLANDNVASGRPTVALKKGQEIKSARCGTWSLRQ